MSARLAILVLALAHSPLAAQKLADSTRPTRRATVTGGMGNSMGWYGVQGERYFAGERLSGFLGLGYTPSTDGSDSGPTFASGVRGFTGGFKHRGFLELSVTQVFVETGAVQDHGRLYGPGLQAGYQFASRGGFTIVASAGVGYAPGVRDGENAFGGLVGLGLGYTWRRGPRSAALPNEVSARTPTCRGTARWVGFLSVMPGNHRRAGADTLATLFTACRGCLDCLPATGGGLI
jgi:hypothetical protein